MIEINNVAISPTNIWGGDGTLNIQASINYTSTVKYYVSVNEYESTITTTTPPATISLNIPFSEFNVGNNDLVLTVTNEAETETETFEYNIIKEDRDTFTMLRRLEHDPSHSMTSNTVLKHGQGIGLSGTGIGSIVINVPTDGKSRVQAITPEVDNTGTFEVSRIIQMSIVGNLGDGRLFEKEIDLKSDEFSKIIGLGVIP